MLKERRRRRESAARFRDDNYNEKKKTKQKYEVTANKANIPEQYLQEVIFPDIISNI